MQKTIRSALSKGIALSVVLIFLILIGFTVVISRLIGRAVGTNPASTTNLLVFMALVGLIAGWAAAKPAKSWLKAVVAGLVTGLVSGILVGAFAFLIGSLYFQGMDMRTYLSALSPEAVRHFLLLRTPADGALSHFLLLLFSSLAGGIIGYFFSRTGLLGKAVFAFRQKVIAPIMSIFHRYAVVRYLLLAILFVILMFLPVRWGSYWNYIMGTVGIYILLGLGLNLIVGLSGQLVLGYVAFFGIGAYGFALLTAPQPHQLEWNFWLALIGGVLLAAFSGVLIGFPILRLRGDYLAIVTLGFGEIIRILLRSDLLTPFTAGPRGVRNLAQPTLFGQSFSSDSDFMYLILIAVFLLVFITSRVQHSHLGRGWVAIREDEVVAQASGVDTYKYKLLALVLGAAFAGLGGALFASRNHFTGPEDHVLMVSINVLALVIVGGMGSIPGVILGAFALKGLPEMLRDLENYRLLVFGALLVAMMIVRPEGLWPAARRRLELHDKPEETVVQEPGTFEAETNR